MKRAKRHTYGRARRATGSAATTDRGYTIVLTYTPSLKRAWRSDVVSSVGRTMATATADTDRGAMEMAHGYIDAVTTTGRA